MLVRFDANDRNKTVLFGKYKKVSIYHHEISSILSIDNCAKNKKNMTTADKKGGLTMIKRS